MRFVIALILLFAGSNASANEVERRTTKILDTWQGWVGKNKIEKASIAISYKGKFLASKAIGQEASEPAPVLSISKMITGICVAKLVEQGRLSFDDVVQEIVPQLASTASIASLLNQTAGYTADVTQQSNARYPGVNQEYLTEISKWEIEETADNREPGKWRYNNSHYAILGAVIVQVTGKTYEQACGDLVLRPAGIGSAKLWEAWRILSSWGGWVLSTKDMISFFDHYFGAKTVLGKSPVDFPNHNFSNGIYYGMGYVFGEGRNGGFNFWHDGRWHAERDGIKYRNGAYLVRWDNGWAVAVNHNISAIEGEHGALDRLLSSATHDNLD